MSDEREFIVSRKNPEVGTQYLGVNGIWQGFRECAERFPFGEARHQAFINSSKRKPAKVETA